MKKIIVSFLFLSVFCFCSAFDYTGQYENPVDGVAITITESYFYNSSTKTKLYIELLVEFRGMLYFRINGFSDKSFLVIRQTPSGDITAVLFGEDMGNDIIMLDKINKKDGL